MICDLFVQCVPLMYLCVCMSICVSLCVCVSVSLCVANEVGYLGGKLHLMRQNWLVCCKTLLYMVEYLRPSATISRWTVFLTGCCNCAIQDGVFDGRHTFASTLKKDSHNLTHITLSNVNRFSKHSRVKISTETFYESMKKFSTSP